MISGIDQLLKNRQETSDRGDDGQNDRDNGQNNCDNAERTFILGFGSDCTHNNTGNSKKDTEESGTQDKAEDTDDQGKYR